MFCDGVVEFGGGKGGGDWRGYDFGGFGADELTRSATETDWNSAVIRAHQIESTAMLEWVLLRSNFMKTSRTSRMIWISISYH